LAGHRRGRACGQTACHGLVCAGGRMVQRDALCRLITSYQPLCIVPKSRTRQASNKINDATGLAGPIPQATAGVGFISVSGTARTLPLPCPETCGFFISLSIGGCQNRIGGFSRQQQLLLLHNPAPCFMSAGCWLVGVTHTFMQRDRIYMYSNMAQSMPLPGLQATRRAPPRTCGLL
jgi:hypothetical protein